MPDMDHRTIWLCKSTALPDCFTGAIHIMGALISFPAVYTAVEISQWYLSFTDMYRSHRMSFVARFGLRKH